MTGYFEHLPPEDEADLAALADGCLTGPRRAELAARVAADPTLAEALERQRTALAMIAAAAESASLDLRLRIEELRAAPSVPRLWARRRRPAPRARRRGHPLARVRHGVRRDRGARRRWLGRRRPRR